VCSCAYFGVRLCKGFRSHRWVSSHWADGQQENNKKMTYKRERLWKKGWASTRIFGTRTTTTTTTANGFCIALQKGKREKKNNTLRLLYYYYYKNSGKKYNNIRRRSIIRCEDSSRSVTSLRQWPPLAIFMTHQKTDQVIFFFFKEG
jgi:hypothetical protein